MEVESIILPIDIGQLISAIYISPDAEPILQDVVTDLLDIYQVKAPVYKSAVMSAPDYLLVRP